MNKISRRSIIRNLAIGGAGMSLFAKDLVVIRPAGKRKAGSGAGRIRLLQYRSVGACLQQTKNCYLAGIVTGTPSKAETWKPKYNIPDKNIYNYQTFDQIANNDDIDVVYVVLPPSMHKEYVIRAANAGKHVWCEKPMAMTATECQEMIDACNKNKRSLAIGYRLHHEPNTQEYRRILKQKLLGMQKVWIVRQATGIIVPIIGNKKKKWVAVCYMIWVFMQSRVQDWERIWNLLPLFPQKLQPQDRDL